MHQEQENRKIAVASLGSKMLLSLHHEAVVEIARTTLTGEEITQITYGSIIELDKAVGEPVDLVVEGKPLQVEKLFKLIMINLEFVLWELSGLAKNASQNGEISYKPIELAETKYSTGRFHLMDVVVRRWSSLIQRLCMKELE